MRLFSDRAARRGSVWEEQVYDGYRTRLVLDPHQEVGAVSAEENKAVVRRYFDEFHSRRVGTTLEQIMTVDLLEPTRQVADRLRTAFPDYQLTIDDQLAEGDRVATVWTGSGTQQGEWAS